MNSPFRLTCLTQTIVGCVFSIPISRTGSFSQEKPAKKNVICSKAALAAVKPIPALDYECSDNQDEDLKSDERREALKAYSKQLESTFAAESWWSSTVDDLNACATVHEARDLTEDEQRDVEDNQTLYGDQSTRLVLVSDPCVKYSYITRNAFVLQHVSQQVYATQVVDAFYTRTDPGVSMDLAQQGGETIVVVEKDLSDGSMPPHPSATYSIYSIDPATHRAVPKKLFMDKGKLTNEFGFEEYVLEDEALSKQWHAPEIIVNGKLAPRFYVYTITGRRMRREAYAWNGKYYVHQ